MHVWSTVVNGYSEFIWCFVQPYSQPLQPQHWWKKSVSYSFKVEHHHTFLHTVLYRYIQFLVHLCGSTQLHFFLQCTWSVCVNLSSTTSAHTCVSHCVKCMWKAGIKNVLTGKCHSPTSILDHTRLWYGVDSTIETAHFESFSCTPAYPSQSAIVHLPLSCTFPITHLAILL